MHPGRVIPNPDLACAPAFKRRNYQPDKLGICGYTALRWMGRQEIGLNPNLLPGEIKPEKVKNLGDRLLQRDKLPNQDAIQAEMRLLTGNYVKHIGKGNNRLGLLLLALRQTGVLKCYIDHLHHTFFNGVATADRASP